MIHRFFLPTLLILAACGDPVSTEESAGASFPDDRPVVVLLNAGATVEDTAGLALLFDNDPATCWRTPPGTGPGESIRLLFADGNHPLREIRYEEIPSDTVTPALRLSVFADGRPLGLLLPGRSLICKEPFSSLLIRIDEAAAEEETIRSLEEGVLTTRRLPAEARVVLGELRFFDAEGTEYRLLPPRILEGEIRPSSNLSPVVDYHAGLLFDGRTDRAWIEGAEGAGSGESIRFYLHDSVRISELVVWSGQQTSGETYLDHARPLALSFGHPDSTRLRWRLEDTPGAQYLPLHPWLEGDTFLLEILEVIPGRLYRDLALSELCFREGERALVVRSDWPARAREEYRHRARETLLAPWLDRRIFNVVASGDGDFYRRQSCLFRSDGTFTAYTEDWSAVDNETFETVTRGNWQLIDGDPERARLRVTGRRTNYALLPDDPAAAVQTFTDDLLMENGELRGERYLDLYFLY